MAKIMRHVLKADEVALDGSLSLSMDAVATQDRSSPQSVPSNSRIRITENHPEYAVLEVTCSCGKITYVRCDYAAAQPPLAPQDSANG